MEGLPYDFTEGFFDKDLEEKLPKFFDPESDTIASKQRRWEHRIAGMMITHYGLVKEAKEMRRMAQDQTGLGRLTLEAFFHFHPSFPMWLSARKIPYVHKTTWKQMKELTKLRIYKEFVEAEDEAPAEYSNTGIIFEWLHSPWTTAIMHNCYRESQREGVVMYWVLPKTNQYLAIESFESFLGSLPWAPDGSDNEHLVRRDPQR